MQLNIEMEVAKLRHMTAGQLREHYAKVIGEETRSYHKTYLIRRIIWRLQAKAEGDLSVRARRRAELLADDAEFRLAAPPIRIPTIQAWTANPFIVECFRITNRTKSVAAPITPPSKPPGTAPAQTFQMADLSRPLHQSFEVPSAKGSNPSHSNTPIVSSGSNDNGRGARIRKQMAVVRPTACQDKANASDSHLRPSASRNGLAAIPVPSANRTAPNMAVPPASNPENVTRYLPSGRGVARLGDAVRTSPHCRIANFWNFGTLSTTSQNPLIASTSPTLRAIDGFCLLPDGPRRLTHSVMFFPQQNHDQNETNDPSGCIPHSKGSVVRPGFSSSDKSIAAEHRH